MALDSPLVIGKNTNVLLTIDRKKVNVLCISGSVKPRLTEWDDHVNGERRARLGQLIDWYDINLSVRVKDMSPLLAFLGYGDNLDADAPPQIVQMGLLFSPPGGSRQSFVASDITLGAYQLSWSNRADRIVHDIPMRATEFGPAATL